jgi:hypothetical protein
MQEDISLRDAKHLIMHILRIQVEEERRKKKIGD